MLNMEINGKIILYCTLIVLILLLILANFGVINFSFDKTTGATGNTAISGYSNIPKKCRPPIGQDLTSWKEHLGHHADTQDCLSYFN